MRTELPVRAAEDIRFSGGMLLASAGERGVALVGLKPNRPQHYGLVPVRWHGRRRAFWIHPDRLKSKFKLDPCITQPPAGELDLSIPASRNGGIAFGYNLKMFRKARGLSQSELAEAMSEAGMERISQTSISNWEHRADCPSGEFLEAAAGALDVPAFAFFVQLDCVKVEHCLEYIRDLRNDVCRETDG